MKWSILSALTLLPVLAIGCKDSAQNASQSTPAVQASAALPSGFILASAPPKPLDVRAARKSLKPGDEVVVRGRIGGGVEPFVAGRTIFQLVDSSVPTCADLHEEGVCPTPWDYCCEPKDQLTASSLTVQVVGENGKPLPVSLKGQAGLNPMARVVVRGKVDDKADAGNMIVRAEGIYVETGTTKPATESQPAAGHEHEHEH